MVRYQVILAYDGTRYLGFQRQAGARTVQDEVEKALRQLNWHGKTLLAAGRTDTGVHANGQVIAFDLDWGHTEDELLRALNAHLPEDVAARQVCQAVVDFHPRYDAVSRKYLYRIYCQSVRHPLLERYAWRVWPAADLVTLQKTADLLPGRHDFATFGTPPRRGGNTIRTISQAAWRLNEPYLEFTVTADAFLYHMVRRLVSLQVEIGQGKRPMEAMVHYLQKQPSEALQGLAPSQGLTLLEVNYEARVRELEKDDRYDDIVRQ
jgi:tRNA pseudouridine38-40 synthase